MSVYPQLYNEEVVDLLQPDSAKLQVHESKEAGVYVAGLREDIVTCPEQVTPWLYWCISVPFHASSPSHQQLAGASTRLTRVKPSNHPSTLFSVAGPGAARGRRPLPPLWRDQDEQEQLPVTYTL
jgi:hypothetical protein